MSQSRVYQHLHDHNRGKTRRSRLARDGYRGKDSEVGVRDIQVAGEPASYACPKYWEAE